jgi:RES domain
MTSEFKTWLDFLSFAAAVKYKSRHIQTAEATNFLSTLLRTSGHRHRTLASATTVWRAQFGYVQGEYHEDTNILDRDRPFPPGRMKPLSSVAFEGRANPKGIPCLYVATDRDTAMSEVRPAVGSKISLGEFRIARDLRLVDFSVGHDSPFGPPFGEPTTAEVVDNVWSQVDRAFSEPVSETPSTAEYAPTQVIAEHFRSNGFDGLVYKSKLGPGLNMVLFDLGAATMRSCSLFAVREVRFTFEDQNEAY